MKEEDLNRIVLAYLKKKGYRNAEAAFQADSKTQSFQEMVYGQGNDLDVSILNQVYLFNKGENVPSRYGESYGKLLAWVHNSLDLYKNELSRILYPIFVHCFLQLVAKGYPTEARNFFQAFKADHQSAHGRDLQKLEGVSNPQHLLDNDLAKSYRENKISVKLCQYSCELLISFLHDSEMMLMLSLVNEHLNLEVVPGQPSPLPEEDEAFTVTGKPQEALENLNRSEIRWGQLEDGIEHRFEEKLAEEAAEGANEEKKDGDPSKPPSKKLKKDGKAGGAGKAGKQGAKAVASNVTRVPSVIPLPRLSEEVEGLAFEDLRKRVQLSSAALPSVCFYTFMNHYNSLNTVALSSDGSKVAAGFSDSSVKVWDMSKRTVSQPQEQYAEMRTSEGAGPGPGSQSQAASAPGSMGYSLLQAHSGPVYGADFSPDVQFLLSSSADTTVRLWSMELGANLVCYKGHNYPVWDVRFSPLGHYFATASHDRTARVWATDRIHPLRIMAGHLSDVDCVRWHPSCNYIATGSSDKTVRLWDVATGECMRIFTGHRSTVLSLAMSPDGRHMASADEDGTIMVWDLGSGRKVVTPLLGRNGCVWSLAFSSEGSLLASGSEDNTVRIWDVGASTRTSKGDDKPGSARRLRLVKTLPTKNTPVYSLQFSPRNLLFAAGAAQRPKNEARK